MSELTKLHPSMEELTNYLKKIKCAESLESVDSGDCVSIHIEECIECQQRLTKILCDIPAGNAKLFEAIRDEDSDATPAWLEQGTASPEKKRAVEERRFRQHKASQEKQFASPATTDSQSTRYRLIEEVARGGMGVVFRALDQAFDRQVAVKVIADDNVDVNRFKREAKISGQLQHPGIVPIHDYGVLQNGEPFIAMKLVEGKTLREIFESGLISKNRLLEVFSQVCQTVAYSHSKHVVHRDLKPANIMVGEFGEVQIMDWGLAKEVNTSKTESYDEGIPWVQDSSTVTTAEHSDETNRPNVNGLAMSNETLRGTVVGTPAYMPREQALGRSVGLTADVFALGGILCEILTGKPPFIQTEQNQNKSIASRFENDECQLDQSIERLNSCPSAPALVELAKHCLALEASSRPSNAAIVSARFNEYTEGRDQLLKEVELERASSAARLQVETKRRKQVFRMTVAIAAILAATTIATVLYLNERNKRQAILFLAEKTAIKERVAAESRLSSIMANARTKLQLASLFDPNKVSAWQEAKVEIKRGFEIVDSVVNPELLHDIKELDAEIQSGLKLAQQSETQMRFEKQAAETIDEAVKLSTYPNDQLMEGKAKPGVAQTLEKAFTSLGVGYGSDVTEAARKISSSSFKGTLISGLKTWELQHRYNQSGELEHIKWFEDLTNEVDPDEFRVRVRKLISQHDVSQVNEIIGDPRALESVANVHAVYNYLRSAGEKKKLLEFLKRACLKFPNDYVINDTLFVLHRQFHPLKPELGLRYALVCLALQPDNPRVLLHVSSLYLALHENDSAIEACNRLIELFPKFPQPYVYAGKAFSEKEEFDKAIEFYQKAIEVAPNFDKTYYNFGLLLDKLDQGEQAVEMMQKAIELNSEFSRYHIAHCNVLLNLDRIDSAEEAVLRGLELQPKDAEGLKLITKILHDRGAYDEAIEFHKLQIKYFKHRTDTWAGYAETLYAAKRYEKAENLIEEPFKRHFQPLYADVLARAQWAQDKKQEAIETLELQLKNRPNSASARKLLKRYRAELAD